MASSVARGRSRPVGIGRALGLAVVVGLALQVVFLLLTTAAMAVPDGPVVAHLLHDGESGVLPPDGAPALVGGSIRDTWTECLAATLGVDPQHRGPLTRAILSPTLDHCGLAGPGLTAVAAGQPPQEPLDYWRYWGGYVALSRPLIALGGLGAARAAGLVVVAAAMVALVAALRRRTGMLAALALLGPLALASDLLVSGATVPQGYALAVVLLTCAAAARWGRSLPAAALIATAGGAGYNYVDTMANPPLAAAYAALGVMLAVPARGLLARAWRGLAAGALWYAGYAATWVVKWLLAAAVIGPSAAIENLRTQMLLRTEGEGASRAVDVSVLGPWRATTRFWLDNLPLAHVVAVVTILLAVAVAAGAVLRRRAGLGWLLTVAVAGLVAVPWLFAVRQQTSWHTFFTYRVVPGLCGVIWLAAAAAWRPRRAEPGAGVVAGPDRSAEPPGGATAATERTD